MVGRIGIATIQPFATVLNISKWDIFWNIYLVLTLYLLVDKNAYLKFEMNT